MGLYKELQHELEELNRQQTQIYPDAADFGIRVGGINDQVCKKIKLLLTEPFYCAASFKQTRTQSNDNFSQSVTVSFHIPWERDEYDRSKSRCSKWTISYWKSHRQNHGIVSLSEENVTVPDSEVWANPQ